MPSRSLWLSILRVDDRVLSLVVLSDARVGLLDPPRQIPEPHRDRHQGVFSFF